MRVLRPSVLHQLICQDHGVHDHFPCPWPNCKNGIPETSFEEESLLLGEPRTLHTRREWRSPLGGSYYTWDSSKLPNWFAVQKTLWNEARRLQLIETKIPAFVYHYTSLEGFAGIVQSRSVWLSDYSYLNDKHELTYGTDLICEVAAKMHESEDKAIVLELLQTWRKNIEQFGNRVCIASFSAEDDSLSQWRSYGPIALGFETHNLAMHTCQSHLRPVEYDRAKQLQLISIYLHHLCQAYVVDHAEKRLERIPDVYHKTEQLIELIAFFKNSAFHSEKEFRLSYIENPEVLEAFDQQPPSKRFRITNSKIIPYIPSTELFMGINKPKPLVISEVVLGPETSEILERGLREFLVSYNMGDVIIRRSVVPYRISK
jgi:hypothetical protein